MVQAQGHIGIFGRVRAGLLQGNLVKGQLLDALAGNVLEAGGGVAQVLERQTVHIVAAAGGVEHIGLQHGVVGNALHHDPARLITTDGAVGQNIHVVLGVLSDLGFARVFQQRLEGTQNGVAVQLLRHAHIGVGQRDVGRFAGFDRERQTHQLRLLRVQAGGFGVKGNQLGVIELFQPYVKPRLIEDGFVLLLGLGRRLGGFVYDHLASTLGLALDLGNPAFELKLGVQLDQFFAVRRLEVQVFQADIQRHIDLDRRQLIGQKRHFPVFFEFGRQVFGATDGQGRHDIELFVQIDQTTAYTHQQAGRSLRTNARYAWNVVGRIAHQREVVDDLLGRNAEFLFDAFDVHHAAGHGVDQGDMAIDQLGHVLVTGGDDHWSVCCRTAACQRADHIVRLDPFNAQQREAQRDHAGVQGLDLYAHVIGHARAIGLVLGVHVIAKCPALGVENYRERTVRVLLAQAFEHVQHALYGAGRQPLGRSQRRQRVKGAVQI